MGAVGIVLILAAAWAMSVDRKAVSGRLVVWGLGLQFALAILVLKTPFRSVFDVIGQGFNQTFKYAEQGSAFVFGKLGSSEGPEGVVLAFQVLPLIIFIASLFAILYALGLMQVVVRAMAAVMQKTLGVSGAECLNVAANVFMGQNEAPLTIRPYLDQLTRSELMIIMTGGMATVSGALMVAYAQMAGAPVEQLLTAVVMNAPAAIVMGKILVPETGTPQTLGDLPKMQPDPDEPREGFARVIYAAAKGAGEGLNLSLMVGAMLVVFVALIALVNGILGGIHEGWSLEGMLGTVFAPIAFVLGVPWTDAPRIGNLLGMRLVLNEFIAYIELGKIREALAPQSFLVASYALCGFANLGSIGIQVGGIGSLMPNRRAEMASLGLRAMIAATLANFLTAAIAGLLG